MSALIINANAMNIPLANKSVHTIVTSPPYYGLRDYGTAKWEGGDPECEHTVGSGDNDNLKGYVTRPERDGEKRQYCQKCGAIRIDAQIGLEVTPDAYIANLVAVFRECKRILRDDGTLWVNIGDSYTSMKSRYNQKAQTLNGGKAQDNEFRGNKTDLYHHPELGLKDKDLIGIPWMLAFALRADGWYLRQDIIWHKPNPMPESVKDRCTKSHEYIFLLSKSAKYYYDSEAVKEPVSDVSMKRAEYGWDCDRPSTKNGSMGGDGIHTEKMGARFVDPAGRNKRDVWTVTTKPYKGAHYATFPTELIKPCILAGAPETCCAKCGAPYERIVEKTGTNASNEKGIAEMIAKGVPRTTANLYVTKERGNSITTGYRPTCTCNAGTSSGIVFDPFVGSGTTVATAIQLGRKGIGLDLSLTYLYENAKDRIKAEMLPLLTLIEQE